MPPQPVMISAQRCRYVWMTSASSSGSSRSDSAVEATMSHSITVNWRRSAGRMLLMRIALREPRPIVLQFAQRALALLRCVRKNSEPNAEVIVEIGNATRLHGGAGELASKSAEDRSQPRLEGEGHERSSRATLPMGAEEVDRCRSAARGIGRKAVCALREVGWVPVVEAGMVQNLSP